MGNGSCQFVQFVAEKWVATAVPTPSPAPTMAIALHSQGTMIWMGTAVPNPRKSVQSVAKKDNNEFK